MKKEVKISVIMSTFREPYEFIQKSIESILSQSYSNFEFLIAVDDPFNYDMINLIKKYKLIDKRIELIVNPCNLGQAISRNKLIFNSKGEYIAVMDADDESLPTRLEEQLEYLEENKDIGILGAGAYKMDITGKVFGEMNIPTTENCFKLYLENGLMPIIHPTLMARREVFILLGGYRNVVVEDFDLLLRASLKRIKMKNLNKPLIKYRIYDSENRISSSKAYYQFRAGRYIMMEYKRRAFSENIDNFNRYVYKKNIFITISKSLFNYSRRAFEKACNAKSKKDWKRFIIYFGLSLLSPEQIMNIYRLIKVKLMCKFFKT